MDLLTLNFYDFIFFIGYYFIKIDYFVSCIKTITDKEIYNLFIDNIYCYHRLSKRTQYVSRFERFFFKMLNMDKKLSFVLHSQTNGQAK